MHVLFVHKNFPAQFGHVATLLAARQGARCTFVSELPDGEVEGVRRIQYRPRGGAARHTHYFSRTFENYIAHSHGVYEALKARPDICPDLVVGHSGFGSTLFLADLYDCPIINYCEYYYHSSNSDIDFRPEFPTTEANVLRSRARNAMLLLDLQTCSAAYSPTEWQRSRFPPVYRDKIEAIFDGVDTRIWRRIPDGEIGQRMIAGHAIPDAVKLVTYVSRGFESMRGFDIFMRVAKRVYTQRRDVVFICVGSDRICYGGDSAFLRGGTFRDWVCSNDDYDLSRFVFTGPLPRTELARLLNLSDAHIYLTVPFVLSWSLLNALACGATVVASDTEPVREIITHEKNGLLARFYDVESQARLVLDVLDRPEHYRRFGDAGSQLIEEKYSVERTFPQMLAMYERVLAGYESHGRPPAFRMAGAPPRGRPPQPMPPSRPRVVTSLGTSEGANNTANGGTRILICIPHYHLPSRESRHGSTRADTGARVAALSRCITALHENFGGTQYLTNLARAGLTAANSATHSRLDVVVCTTRGRHCLESLKLPASYFTHFPADCEGPMLGFQCHSVLRERLGSYDYYCYLEDDLVILDPWFFAKLKSFVACAGADCLLQAHRYERLHDSVARKAYVDGDLPPAATSRYQDVRDRPGVTVPFLGERITCNRVLNPHSGCFFLDAAQMAQWCAQPHFLDLDTSFYSALESAATLGVLKTFRIYKPAIEVANFLEIQHCGSSLLRRIADRDAAIAVRGQAGNQPRPNTTV